ncbi:MAG: histidine phosphatase family protein [Dehalococcoidia bacterium]
MRLLLIRHGESTANAEGRLQGHLDFALSEQGRRESELLGGRLTSLGVDALYTSTLARARETAQIAGASLDITPVGREGLMERDVGALSGLNHIEIRERFPDYVRARSEGRIDVEIDGWESYADFRVRVDATLDAIVADHKEGTVACVTHGGVIGMFLRRVLDLPVVRPVPFAIGNTSVSTFEVPDFEMDPRFNPRILLISLNDTCHLDGQRPHEDAPDEG